MFLSKYAPCTQKLLASSRISTLSRNEYSTKKETRKKLTPEDMEVVLNPTMDYWKSFMKGYGSQRTDFKLSDHYIWKETFKDDYKMIFICLKGTKQVIGTLNGFQYRPLSSHKNNDTTSFGFLWVEKEYRGAEIMKIMSKSMQSVTTEARNNEGYAKNVTIPFWTKTHTNSKVGFNLNLSSYKGEDVKIPNPPLVFDDIIVKSAHDVPDDDITNYDQSIYPFERREYMLRHLRDPVGFGKVAYDRDGKVVGIGTVTLYPSGDATLCPMYADNDRIAQAMFQECLKDIDEAGIKVKHFEARMPEIEGLDNLSWMIPFLAHEPKSEYLACFVYTHNPPVGLNFKKVYCQVFTSFSTL